jgi:hypothetical protein
VLLSPASGTEGLEASTVLVSARDATSSQPATPACSRRPTAGDGSETTEQEWQIL